MGLISTAAERRSSLPDHGPTPDPLDGGEHRRRDSTPLARAQGFITLGGVSLGYLGIILPHPEYFNVTALLVTQTSTLIAALGMIIFASRVPPVVLVLTPILGTISAASGVYFSGDPVSAYALFFLWPPFYAFYFMSRPAAIVHCILVVVSYGITVLITPDNGGGAVIGNTLHHYVIVCGSVAVAAVLIAALRSRINDLVRRLTDAARSDLLTGLLNARGFSEDLNGELERARMNAHRVTVLLLQLTGLRDAQKAIGQDAGEELIADFGRLLEDATRQMDTVARTGFSEFALSLPETDQTTGFMVAEQILARARRQFRDRGVTVAASIGVASFPRHAADTEGLIQTAAAAGDAAKMLGADRAVVHSAELQGALGGEGGRALQEQRSNLRTVLNLAEVLELRDPRLASHSSAVARYAELLGAELGLPEPRCQRLRLAGLLHDVGKIGIADSIFQKPGPLSPAEWDEVRRHPELAGRILSSRELADVREWIWCRHEQLDGHGYPRGIEGDQVPLESRILAVAETYDALTSERPYRSALDHDGAMAEMSRYVGSQFDGAVLDAMARILKRTGAQLTAPEA